MYIDFMRTRPYVLILLTICLIGAGCAAKAPPVRQAPAETGSTPQEEISGTAAGDNETVPSIPPKEVSAFRKKVEQIDARYYPLLSRATKYLTSLDSYLAAHDMDLFADRDMPADLRAAYRDMYEQFGGFYTAIDEYAVWYAQAVPDTQSLRYMSREQFELKKEKLVFFARKLKRFQNLPDKIDRLFNAVKNR